VDLAGKLAEAALADESDEAFDEAPAEPLEEEREEPAAAAKLFGFEFDFSADTADAVICVDFPGAAVATLVGFGTGSLSPFASSTGFASGFMTCHHGRCFAAAGAGASATAFLEVATGAGAAVTFETGVTFAFGAGSAADGRGAPSVGTGGLSVETPDEGTGAVVWG
jgi:hypothetical protein